MSDRTGSFFAFIVGGAIGSVITLKLVEKKYKQIADEEIASVKEVYNRKMQNKVEQTAEAETKNKENYSNVVTNLGYTSETNKKEEEKDMVDNAKVYVIPPESFGEYGFETESLTYYADKVLAFNATNKVIKNVDEVVGRGSLETFGEYEDDSVFVRNENMKKDIEILLDTRKYSDIVSTKPHLVTDDDE